MIWKTLQNWRSKKTTLQTKVTNHLLLNAQNDISNTKIAVMWKTIDTAIFTNCLFLQIFSNVGGIARKTWYLILSNFPTWGPFCWPKHYDIMKNSTLTLESLLATPSLIYFLRMNISHSLQKNFEFVAMASRKPPTSTNKGTEWFYTWYLISKTVDRCLLAW